MMRKVLRKRSLVPDGSPRAWIHSNDGYVRFSQFSETNNRKATEPVCDHPIAQSPIVFSYILSAVCRLFD